MRVAITLLTVLIPCLTWSQTYEGTVQETGNSCEYTIRETSNEFDEKVYIVTTNMDAHLWWLMSDIDYEIREWASRQGYASDDLFGKRHHYAVEVFEGGIKYTYKKTDFEPDQTLDPNDPSYGSGQEVVLKEFTRTCIAE